MRPELPPILSNLAKALERDILRRGVLVPILVAPDGEVIDGRSRLEIGTRHKLYVPRIVVGKVSDADRADLRVVLNGLRRQLTRAQLNSILEWELRKTPGESDRKIAARIGADHKTVGEVRSRLESGGEIPHVGRRDGADGKRYASTRKPIVITTSDVQAREAASLLSALGDEAPNRPVRVRDLKSGKYAKDRAEKAAAAPTVRLGQGIEIYCCDYREIGIRVPERSADLVLGDPPWGVAWARNRRSYAETAYRVLKPGGYLACYTGTPGLYDYLKAFEAAGLLYRWAFSCPRNNVSVRYEGCMRSRWVPVVICQRPPRSTPFPTVISDRMELTSSEKNLHEWQQPVEESRLLVLALTEPGGSVVDLTCGAGTSGIGVLAAGGGRRWTGVDIDPNTVRIARARVDAELKRLG